MADRLNIALIDDDMAGLEAIRYCLENDLNPGTAIHAFTNGNKFLEMLHEKPFHLIVSDLEMPDISGIEIIQHVKTYTQGIPIIVLTGNTNLLRHNLEIRKYIFEVLIKPVEYKQLLRTIKDGLACSDFLFLAKDDATSIDDTRADKRLTEELLAITKELRENLAPGANYDVGTVIQLLDSQEKLLKILKEKTNL